MTSRGVKLAVAVALAGLVAVPAAHASVVSRDGNVVRVEAVPGEVNQMSTQDFGGNFQVTEVEGTIDAGAGCVDMGQIVECGTTATVMSLVVNLGDQADFFFNFLPPALTLDAGPGNDTVFGTTSNDSISGGSGRDELGSGGGNDTIDGGEGNDSIVGETGDDTLLGGEGDDGITDSGGANTLSGGPGDDDLVGGPGADQLLGGPDDDDMLYSNRLVGADVVDGGAGYDYANLFSEGEPMSISLDGVANDGAAGQNANFLAVESISGGAAADTITGSGAPESLSGGGGPDVIAGMGGNDSLNGGSQNDTLDGGDANDFLDGSNGDDIMRGGAANDELYGREGADDMSGGDGRDTVNFGNGSSYDAGASVTFDNVANDGAAGEGDNARGDNENVIGTGGPDFIVGGPGTNTITGGQGPDLIVVYDGAPGTASRDHALCGAGEDTVRADPLDAIGVKEELCENVAYGDLAGWGPNLAVTAFGRGVLQPGVLPLELGCPFRARGACEGTVELRVGGRRAGRVRFSIAAGEVVDRSLKLNRRVRRALRRGRVRGSLVSTVEDEIGATKTATKRVTLTP